LTLAATVGASLLVTACGSTGVGPTDSTAPPYSAAGSGSAVAQPATRTASVATTPTTSATARLADLSKACTVLTKQDAAQFIKSFGETYPSETGCEYNGSDPSEHLGIKFNSGPSYPGGWSTEVKTLSSAISAAHGTSRTLSIDGHQAIIWSNPTSGRQTFRGIEWDYRPDKMLVVLTAQPADLVSDQRLVDLANTVQSRLPS
jgi:hypothetical protein